MTSLETSSHQQPQQQQRNSPFRLGLSRGPTHSTSPSVFSAASTSIDRMPSVSGLSSISSNGHSRLETNATSLSVATHSHARPSPAGGSYMNSSAFSNFGLSQLTPASREDMLNRLLIDQTRIDCQEYGLMSLEDVAEAKRELNQIESKIISLRTKLKVETRIRDAGVALRKAHRKTPSTSSAAGFMTLHSPMYPNGLTSPDPNSLQFRKLSASISASEAKAEQDVATASAKVDKVTRELFRISEKANFLRRKILEHQAAALSERVTSLESERAMIEEKLPFVSSSTSFESLGPSASASAVGFRNLEKPADLSMASESRTHVASRKGTMSSDVPYEPKGPTYALKHHRLESDLSAISGFSFLDATAPEKVRILSTELESTRSALEQATHQLELTAKSLQNNQQELDHLRAQLAKEQAGWQMERENHEARLQQSSAQRLEAERKELEAQMARADADRVKEVVSHNARADAAEKLLSAERAHLEKVCKELEDERGLRQRQASEEMQNQFSKADAELKTVRAEFDNLCKSSKLAEDLAAERAVSLDNERKTIQKLERQLTDEQQAKTAAEAKIAHAQKKAATAEVNLRELELAVGVERKIMAERDELFHAFERRLESAEKRLQEQNKRCARMLGKLDGREEMDDLLERIKAGAGGVSRKKKTAGQDIADLLTSLETHIEDLTDELARGGGQGSGPASPALRQMEEELQEAEKEAQRSKSDAEEARKQLEALKVSAAAKPAGPEPSTRSVDSPALLEKIQDLEAQVEKLSDKNTELERQLRSSRLMPSRSVSGNGVSNLVSKFGGGKVSLSPAKSERELPALDTAAEERVDQASQKQIRECSLAIETISRLLPDLDVQPGTNPDLKALQRALEPPLLALPPSSGDARKSASNGSASAVDLKKELDVMAESIRTTLTSICTAISHALQADNRHEDRAEAVESVREDYKQTLDDLKQKLKAVSSKANTHRDNERRLQQTLAEVREQLDALRAERRKDSQRPPRSPVGTAPPLSLGLQTSPKRNGGSLPKVYSFKMSPQKPCPINVQGGGLGYSSPHSTTLAPPRSPLGDGLPSPTRSYSSSPGTQSLRYVPPFASMLETRTGGRAPEEAPPGDHFDTSSVRSGSSPASTTVGLPHTGDSIASSNYTSSSGLGGISSASSASSVMARQQQGPRTIALGMDVPQLISKVRELERELLQTVAIRKHAEKVNEMEIELRNAHVSYADLLKRIESEREKNMEQRVQMLDELNEAQRQLENARSQIRGAK